MGRPRPPAGPPPPSPLRPVATAEFRRDLKRLAKRGKAMDKLRATIERLCDREPLPPRQRDHALQGGWAGWRDCHVEPDWILIYKPTATDLLLGRTGTHADLFE